MTRWRRVSPRYGSQRRTVPFAGRALNLWAGSSTLAMVCIGGSLLGWWIHTRSRQARPRWGSNCKTRSESRKIGDVEEGDGEQSGLLSIQARDRPESHTRRYLSWRQIGHIARTP